MPQYLRYCTIYAMIKVINAYLVKEISATFILALTTLTVTALLSKILKLVDLVINQGVGLLFILKYLLYLLPSVLVYIIPVSFLIALLVAFGRLSGDDEITALKAAGVGLHRLLRPVLGMTFILFLCTLFISTYGFPWGNTSSKSLLFEAAKNKASLGVEDRTFTRGFESVTLYTDKVIRSTDGGEDIIEGIFIYDGRDPKNPLITTATEGIVMTDPGGGAINLLLKGGSILSDVTGNGEARGDKRLITFESYDMNIKLEEGNGAERKDLKNRDLYPHELLELAASDRLRGEDPTPRFLELNRRVSLSISIFIFTFIGIPLGLQRVRSPRLTGFSVALGVVALYFILTAIFKGLGDVRFLNPLVTVWVPNILLGGLGIYGLYMTFRDKPIKALILLSSLYNLIISMWHRVVPERRHR